MSSFNFEVEDELVYIEGYEIDKNDFTTGLRKCLLYNGGVNHIGNQDYQLHGFKHHFIKPDEKLGIALIGGQEYDDSYPLLQLNGFDRESTSYLGADTLRLVNGLSREVIENIYPHYTEEKVLELVNYPVNWIKHEGKIYLNEVCGFKINQMRRAIDKIIIEDNMEVELRYYKIGKYTSKYTYCSVCGGHGVELLKIYDGNKKELERSGICLSCLPSFAKNYLEYDNPSRLTDNIVSKKL